MCKGCSGSVWLRAVRVHRIDVDVAAAVRNEGDPSGALVRRGAKSLGLMGGGRGYTGGAQQTERKTCYDPESF